MSLQLVFASSNANKLTEIKLLLPQKIELLGLQDIHFSDEIEETGKTFEDNAALKANAVFEFSNLNCFADDSGLEVDALDGKPGVKSARYAGEPVDHQKNIEFLLANMQGKKNRKARFKTVVCLRTLSKTFFFEGTVNGTITEQPAGDNGFGYDPVFMPEGSDRTFAQMSIDEKNAISHRKKAIAKMIDFIQYL